MISIQSSHNDKGMQLIPISIFSSIFFFFLLLLLCILVNDVAFEEVTEEVMKPSCP